MADAIHTQSGTETETGQPVPLTFLFNLAGAVTSLALVIGIGVWGYRMVMRDVSGVPVVRAVQGPMRVAPDDPGGERAPYQGLSVNAVLAEGMADPPPDRLILAPAPLDLTLASVHREDPAAREGGARATSRTLAESIAASVEPIGDLPAGTVAAERAEDAAPPVAGGIGWSLRPRTRPASLATSPEAVALAAVSGATVRDVDPDTIALGTRLAQLGAYASREIAIEEWNRLAGRFDEFLAGKNRVIQKAESGGRTFYRLRAMGFDDLGDARRFCSALVAERAECIPVVVR